MLFAAVAGLLACTPQPKDEITASGLKRSDFQAEVDGKKTDLYRWRRFRYGGLRDQLRRACGFGTGTRQRRCDVRCRTRFRQHCRLPEATRAIMERRSGVMPTGSRKVALQSITIRFNSNSTITATRCTEACVDGPTGYSMRSSLILRPSC